MTERVDEHARRAGAAVHARTAAMDADRGLAAVVRRGRRPRAATVLAVVMALLVAVPAAGWLRGWNDTRVELESPAQAPEPPPPSTGEDPAEPDGSPSVPPGPEDEPAATPGPEEDTTAGDDPGEEPRDGSGDDPTPADEPEESDPDGETEPRGPAPVGPFGTGEVSHGDFPSGGGEPALLTDVRLAGHDGFDRVVLEFDGPDVPSYRISYVDPPIIQDGSGEGVSVDGNAFLELRLTPASGVDSRDSDWEPTYHGPERVEAATGAVTEVVRVDDFEANLAWVVGLPTQQPFAVAVLSDPLRLVVDVRTD